MSIAVGEFTTLDYFCNSGLRSQPNFDWPQGKQLAVHITSNLRQIIFNERGVDHACSSASPNHRSKLWRDYGNPVAVWRRLGLFDERVLPIKENRE